MANDEKTAAPGQITTHRYSKDDLRGEMEEYAKQVAQKEAALPCGCAECEQCGECQADVTKARLLKQHSMVTRLNSRVLALLEAAIVS